MTDLEIQEIDEATNFEDLDALQINIANFMAATSTQNILQHESTLFIPKYRQNMDTEITNPPHDTLPNIMRYHDSDSEAHQPQTKTNTQT